MKALMKVAQGVGNVEVRDIPEPHPDVTEVKIKIHSAGICGTDVHILHNEFKVQPPVVMGHEVSGEIVDIGAAVEADLNIGDRITTETYYKTCGTCMHCRYGNRNLCHHRLSIGSGVNGGFTKYLVVPAANIHKLPDNVSFEAGALTEPLACVVHGVLNSRSVNPGDVAIVAGPGAIGLLTTQVLKVAGATVIVLGTDVDKNRLELATQFGADYVVNVQRESPDQLVHEITKDGLGADVVYECSGAGSAAQKLLELVKRKGRYVQIGLFGKAITWDLDQVCYKELIVTGSNASVPSAWDKAIKLLANGQVQTAPLITDRYLIEDWQKAFETFNAKQGVKTLLKPMQE